MPRKAQRLLESPAGLVETFGESRYGSGVGSARSFSLKGTKLEIRGRLRADCPAGPGVYGFVDQLGSLTYVGMSRNLRHRLQTYFSSRAGHRKECRIGRKCRQLVFQPVVHTFVARLRELELIHKFRPQDNVQGQPSRTSLGFIVLTSAAAPSFEVRNSVPVKKSSFWGPLPIGGRTREAVAVLNRIFLLRDCPASTKMRFRNQLPLIEGHDAAPCLRADLATCLAPCIGSCTQAQYSKALRSASKFLDGDDRSVLDRLTAELKEAVVQQRFEKAARLRDSAHTLERLNILLRWFHDWMERATFVYELPAMHEEFQPHGLVVVRGSIAELQPAAGKRACQRILKKYLADQAGTKVSLQKHLAQLPPEHYEIARFLFHWFRCYPEEKERLFRGQRGSKAA